jgi:hypothetical protein
MNRKKLNLIGLVAEDESRRSLSYSTSLPRAVEQHSSFNLKLFNVAALSSYDKVNLALRLRYLRCDAIILFHSTFSNVNYISPLLAQQIATSGRPVVFFPGNEYKLMPEKVEFAKRIRTALLVSQISRAPVHALYRDALGCEVIFLPNALFEPDPTAPTFRERSTDIGYRAYGGLLYLGHEDRERIAKLIEAPAQRRGLKTDISMDPAVRFGAQDWKGFLRTTRAQLGVESGTDVFELTDETRIAVNAYCETKPDADFQEIRDKFFPAGKPRVSGRTISSRHLEAAAARCVQIMFAGEFGGVLSPGEHYIALDRDGTNVDRVLEILDDSAECARMTQAAFDACDCFSASKMMTKFETALRGICG